MKYIGIVGHTPVERDSPVQADRFDRLQRFIGRLETADADRFPALHAACHALMCGVDRVVVSSVPQTTDDADWVAALKRLFRSDPLPIVVAPGGPEEALAQAFVGLPFTGTSCLWLDAPPSAPLAADGRIRVIQQRVPTASPGRRHHESLRGSALIGPLHLGVCASLRGQHGPPTGAGPLAFRAGRVVLAEPLHPPGPRLPSRPAPEHTGVHLLLERAFTALLEPLVLTESVGPALYRRIEREATVLLERFQRQGYITRYRVRCDAATSQGAPGPVVEVLFAEPKRVETVTLRFAAMEAGRLG